MNNYVDIPDKAVASGWPGVGGGEGQIHPSTTCFSAIGVPHPETYFDQTLCVQYELCLLLVSYEKKSCGII